MSNCSRSVAIGVLTTALALAGCTDAPAAPAAPIDSAPELSIAQRGMTIYVTSLPRRDTLAAGESVQLVAAGLDRRGRLITNASVKWSLSDSSLVAVSSTGKVTANSKSGLVTVFAKTSTMTGSKVCQVKGTEAPPQVAPPRAGPRAARADAGPADADAGPASTDARAACADPGAARTRSDAELDLLRHGSVRSLLLHRHAQRAPRRRQRCCGHDLRLRPG